MRFLIEYHGSHEPSIILTGESQDFVELATALEDEIHRAVAANQPAGPLKIPGFQPEGRTKLGFGLTASADAKKLSVKEHSCFHGILVLLAGLTLFYFFCRGFVAFFP